MQTNYILVFYIIDFLVKIYYRLFSLELTFQNKRKKTPTKQQSEWKQTLVSAYFSTPQTASWWPLFMCLFYISKKNFICKTWDLLDSAIG